MIYNNVVDINVYKRKKTGCLIRFNTGVDSLTVRKIFYFYTSISIYC